MRKHEGKIQNRLAQISCGRGDKTANLQKIEEYARKAKEQNAEPVIFPELSLTDYNSERRNL